MKKLLLSLSLLFLFVGSAQAKGDSRLVLEKPATREEKNYQTNDLFKAYLDATSFRHKVLSQNIANINTPGYKADEVEIPTKYDVLIGEKKKIKRVSLAITSEKHILGHNKPAGKFESHKLKDPYEIKPNGNNVSLAQQMTKLSQNQQDYNAAVKGYAATNALLSTTLGK
jgi:flagellar basal-body rod protein FlgB